MTTDGFFKGWAIPGRRPVSVAQQDGLEPLAENVSLDALSGHFKIHQLKDGHRFSTDDLLVAWYGTAQAGAVERALDLGSGIGTVGMIVAWRLPGAKLVTVEAQEVSVGLARRSARLNGLEGRYEIRRGDFRDAGVLADDERFDLVTGSPPYFPLGTGITAEHPQKIACRFEVRGDITNYCQVAARHLAPSGIFACVFPNEQLERVRGAARTAGLAILRHRPVVLKEGEAPLLRVFAMGFLEHLPARARGLSFEEPPLVIRMKEGSVGAEYQVIKLSIGFPP